MFKKPAETKRKVKEQTLSKAEVQEIREQLKDEPYPLMKIMPAQLKSLKKQRLLLKCLYIPMVLGIPLCFNFGFIFDPSHF